MDCSLPGSSVLGFPRQESWNGLTFPSLGDLPDPVIEPGSPALQADSLPTEPPGKHMCVCVCVCVHARVCVIGVGTGNLPYIYVCTYIYMNIK